MKDAERQRESLLRQGFVSRHEASAAALDLFRLLDAAAPDHGTADALRSRFEAAVHAAGFDDLASTQAAYASRLAEAAGLLTYEEMHKLFSLIAELDALERLGYAPSSATTDTLREGVRARFAAQRRIARMVAEDRVEDWPKPLVVRREPRSVSTAPTAGSRPARGLTAGGTACW